MKNVIFGVAVLFFTSYSVVGHHLTERVMMKFLTMWQRAYTKYQAQYGAKSV